MTHQNERMIMKDRPSQLNPIVAMAIMSGMSFGDDPAPLPESCRPKPMTEEDRLARLTQAKEKRERKNLKRAMLKSREG